MLKLFVALLDSTKLFLDLYLPKLLGTSAKSFFSCRYTFACIIFRYSTYIEFTKMLYLSK